MGLELGRKHEGRDGAGLLGEGARSYSNGMEMHVGVLTVGPFVHSPETSSAWTWHRNHHWRELYPLPDDFSSFTKHFSLKHTSTFPTLPVQENFKNDSSLPASLGSPGPRKHSASRCSHQSFLLHQEDAKSFTQGLLLGQGACPTSISLNFWDSRVLFTSLPSPWQ